MLVCKNRCTIPPLIWKELRRQTSQSVKWNINVIENCNCIIRFFCRGDPVCTCPSCLYCLHHQIQICNSLLELKAYKLIHKLIHYAKSWPRKWCLIRTKQVSQTCKNIAPCIRSQIYYLFYSCQFYSFPFDLEMWKTNTKHHPPNSLLTHRTKLHKPADTFYLFLFLINLFS